MRVLLPTVLVVLLPLAAISRQDSQGPKAPERPNSPPTVSGDRTNPEQSIGLPDEMRIRLAIERAEGDHRKVLEDVKKMSDLAVEISDTYHDHSSLASDDMKKLVNIEKLAKRILTHAGGSEVDDKSKETEKLSVGEAVEHLNAAVTRIKNDMTAQTRHIVSAVVIASSNEVITLTHLIRRKQKSD